MMINYYLVTKPGIILGNLFTVAAGFFLASKGLFHFGLFFATLIGLMFVIASGCVLNNYIDRQVDKKMERTKNRPLVTGLISGRNAIFFAISLAVVGDLTLFLYTNLLTLLIANVGFFVYVFLYSMWKCRTVYGTAIGSISGAVPPIVGYCAVTNQFDRGAIILFAIMILWQMPHFFAIAVYRLRDYAAASIPVLPIKKGMQVTKVHMLLYIIGFIPATLLLTYYGYTGYLYLTVVALVGLIWLGMCIQGFKSTNNERWARKMFVFSLVIVMALNLMILVDVN